MNINQALPPPKLFWSISQLPKFPVGDCAKATAWKAELVKETVTTSPAVSETA